MLDVEVVVLSEVIQPLGKSSSTDSLYEVKSLPVFAKAKSKPVSSPRGTSNGPRSRISAS